MANAKRVAREAIERYLRSEYHNHTVDNVMLAQFMPSGDLVALATVDSAIEGYRFLRSPTHYQFWQRKVRVQGHRLVFPPDRTSRASMEEAMAEYMSWVAQ